MRFGAFARFSPDSARTKIPSAKIAATQKINRAALDIFIILAFHAPGSGIYRIAADALRFGERAILRRRQRVRQAESFERQTIWRFERSNRICRCSRVSVRRVNRAYNRPRFPLRTAKRLQAMDEALASDEAAVLAWAEFPSG